jgi:hypothetical protein
MTTTTATETPTWDDVLAQVEDDVARTEALLSAAAVAARPAATSGDEVTLAPAETMLPSDVLAPFVATGPDLPAISSMPPIPPELLDRIVALRSRIQALRMEIATELTQLRAAEQPSRAAHPHVPRHAYTHGGRPRFVDRQL